MQVLTVFLMINFLIVLASSLDLESYGLSDCGITFNLEKTGDVTIISDNFGIPGKCYEPQCTCSWSFIGHPKCIPKITCDTFEIQKLNNDCSAEYFSITDGSGEGKKFCGDGGGKVLYQSKTRDLYVTFQAGEIKKTTKGFRCKVQCSKLPIAPSAPVISPEFALKENPQCICGLQNKDDRIMGGEDAKLNEFPWLVAIVHAGTRIPHCGASLINDKYILSAAHCFDGLTNPKYIEILVHAQVLDQNVFKNYADVPFGEPGSMLGPGFNLSAVTDADEKSQRYKVIKITTHPFFEPQFDYDLAILELEKKIDLSKPEAPIPVCLPSAYGEFQDDYVGKVPLVMGWGLAFEKAGATTRLLQKLKAPVIKLQVCSDYGLGYLTPRMLCAGYETGEMDTCAGDSGGPLVYQKPNKQFVQIGAVSFGLGCGRKFRPGIYARVVEMRSWINQNTPGATWCRATK